MRMSTIATSGSCAAVAAQELLAGADLGDDGEAVIGEQPREALPDHHGVVGQDHAHGISARMRVPVVGRAQDAERAIERLDAVAQPAQPAAVRVGAAAPVVADLDHGVPVRERDVDLARGWRCACLWTLASASAAT